jgi:hypothetical protein
MFKPGQSGNPAGRPKGARHKLTEAFWRDFAQAWETGGIAALEKVMKDDPCIFIRVAASLMPKEMDMTVRRIAAKELTDDELADIAARGGADAADATVNQAKPH